MVSSLSAQDSIRLNAFVMVPASRIKNKFLNNYRIGQYPNTRLKGLGIYDPPKGFVQVTAENVNTPVSPHFTLGQFVCKQAGNYPKYLLLRERLILKLELILRRVNEAGYPCTSLSVMSGYRTPYYNHAIGNVKYSRHVWGDAADIFVDNDSDGGMDDLNGDGTIDVQDAAVLYKLVDELYERPFYAPFIGGLGQYRKTSNHTAFVHVDTRGFRARWGD